MRKEEYKLLNGSVDGWNPYKHRNIQLKKDQYIQLYGEQSWKKESEKRQKKAKVRKYKYHHYTMKGNAESKISGYKKSDMAKGFKSTLTKEQLIDLWKDGCYYCGEMDWKKLGADRMDNSKGHTIDNVVCCCVKCNKQRSNIPFHVFKFMKDNPSISTINIYPFVSTSI